LPADLIAGGEFLIRFSPEARRRGHGPVFVALFARAICD